MVQAPVYSHRIPDVVDNNDSDDSNNSDKQMLTSWLQVIHNVYGEHADLYVDVLGMPPYPPGYNNMYSLSDIQMAYFDRRSELFQILARHDECFGSTSSEMDEQHLSQLLHTEQCMDAVVMAFRILSQPELRFDYDNMALLRKTRNDDHENENDENDHDDENDDEDHGIITLPTAGAHPFMLHNNNTHNNHHNLIHNHVESTYQSDDDDDDDAIFNQEIYTNEVYNNKSNYNNYNNSNNNIIYQNTIIHNNVVDDHAINTQDNVDVGNHHHHAFPYKYNHHHDDYDSKAMMMMIHNNNNSRAALELPPTAVAEDSPTRSTGLSTLTPSIWTAAIVTTATAAGAGAGAAARTVSPASCWESVLDMAEEDLARRTATAGLMPHQQQQQQEVVLAHSLLPEPEVLSTPVRPTKSAATTTKSFSPSSTMALISSSSTTASSSPQRSSPKRQSKTTVVASPKASPSRWLLSRFQNRNHAAAAAAAGDKINNNNNDDDDDNDDDDSPPMARFRPSLLSRITSRSTSPPRPSLSSHKKKKNLGRRLQRRSESRSLSPAGGESPARLVVPTTNTSSSRKHARKPRAIKPKPPQHDHVVPQPSKTLERRSSEPQSVRPKPEIRRSKQTIAPPSLRKKENVIQTAAAPSRGRTQHRSDDEVEDDDDDDEEEEEDELDDEEEDDEEEEEEDAPKTIVGTVMSSITNSTIYLEITGAIYDTAVSVDQVINAFTLQERDIDAVMGRIDKAKRLLNTTTQTTVVVGNSNITSDPIPIITKTRRKAATRRK